LTHDAILKDLKKGNFKPVYFLHGEEPYFIDLISDWIEEHVLPEEQKAFNQSTLYGKDSEAEAIRDAASRLPMMAERQVIILKEAQEMRTLQDLEPYIKNPVPTTLLVIAHKHKKLKLNTRLGKAVKANEAQIVFFEAKKLYDNKVPAWISGFLKEKGLDIKPDAAALVAEYLGSDLSKVANELVKLALNLEGTNQVTTREVEQHIGISKDYNVFELQKAIGQRDLVKSNRIINYFAANPRKNPIQVVVASLFNYFSKLLLLHDSRELADKELAGQLRVNPYFLREYRAAGQNFNRLQVEKVILLLSEYDLKGKGVNYDGGGKPGGELLKEMVWRILHD